MKPYLKSVNVIATPALTEDGEVYTAHKNIEIVVKSEESYFSVYNHILGYSNGCKSLSEFKVLNWIGVHSDYNTNVITLHKFNKNRIIADTKLSSSAVEKAIKSFVLSEILVRDKTCPKCGVYYINPAFIWKGDTNTRMKALKTTLTLIRENNTPEREAEVEQDIKRYKEAMEK